MELLKHINKLYFKDSILLLPTIHAIYFSFCPPSKEVPVFEMGTVNPRSFSRGTVMSIDSMHIGAFKDINDGDSIRIVCPNNNIYIAKNVTFVSENKNNPCQTIIADDVIGVI